MNRIETRIIIMVTNRLAAAKDSDAKSEMIEELSENLYERYLELLDGGVREEDALKKAMESLGDVEELLNYLKEEEEQAESIPRVQEEEQTEETSRMQEQEDAADREEQDAGQHDWNGGFRVDDLEDEIEKIVNAAISTAKAAVDCASDMARDVTGQLKERYPGGVFMQFSGQKERNGENTMTFPAERTESLDIRFTNGDIVVEQTDGDDISVEVEGDTQEVTALLREDGVLSVTQGNTASAAFLFMRGIRRTNVEIRLPEKLWKSASFTTVNGDIEIRGQMSCEELKVASTSGDVTLEAISGENMRVKLSSGDIEGDVLEGNLHAESKSGDISISGSLGRCELFSASGDVSFTGECREMNCSSTSGDVELDMERLPETIRGKSVSGDCEVTVPAGEGFHLTYRTVSGSFSSDIPLCGRVEKKCGDVVCGESVCSDISLSSVSGDISISVS